MQQFGANKLKTPWNHKSDTILVKQKLKLIRTQSTMFIKLEDKSQ